MVAPGRVADAVLTHRARTNPPLSHAGQHVITELARSGDLARHLRRLRRTLAHRRARAASALAAIDISIPGDNAGAHLVIPLQTHAQEQRATSALTSAGLLTDPLSGYGVTGSRRRAHGLVLGITTGSETEYRQHIARLTEALEPVANRSR